MRSPRSTVRALLLKGAMAVVAVPSVLSVGCGEPTAQVSQIELDGPFAAVPRSAGSSSSALKQGLGEDASKLPGNPDESFYVAINKAELGKKWFMSAYLDQIHPHDFPAADSLGTRVVSFKVQNGKLFVFDTDSRKKVSETYDPEVIVEAYPIVTDNKAFNDWPGSANYVLFDPSAGLNDFNVIGSAFSDPSSGSKFYVDLMYSQNFRKVADGATFEQVFTGTSDYTAVGDGSIEPNPFRYSGTVGIALRRYTEGTEYKQVAVPETGEHFFRSDAVVVPNTGGVSTVAAHWNIHPKMKPIEFIISDKVNLVKDDPRFKDYDVYGAIRNGVENWNKVFGFPALTARLAKPGEEPNQDDKNFILFDTDPSFGFAFANWRTNPNTGEIRGASVYFSSMWLEIADYTFDPANQLKNRPAPTKSPVARPALAWKSMSTAPLCALSAEEALAAMAETKLPAANPALTKKEAVEKYLTHVIIHEVGHTLGLRHNFKGSLVINGEVKSSSVMEYITDEDSLNSDVPGVYDVEAIKYLYGLTDQAPTTAFCTDHEVRLDPTCATFDRTSDPLNQDFGPTYTTVLEQFLTGASPVRPNNTLNNVLKFTRAASDPATRLAAWNLATNGIKVPLDSAKVAADAMFAPRADAALTGVIARLYLDSVLLRGAFVNEPPKDSALYADILGQVKAVLLNTDKVRSYASRRAMVDMLKLQHNQPTLVILDEARNAVTAQLAGLTGTDKLETEALLTRINAAIASY